MNVGGGGGEFLSVVAVKGGEAGDPVLLFDVAHSDAILLESGLKDLLESTHWIKVLLCSRGQIWPLSRGFPRIGFRHL